MVRRVLGVVTANVLVLSVFIAVASTPAVAAAPVLIHAINSWQWSPPGPDSSGIAYLPGVNRLQVDDSEVEETTGAGFHNVSTWQITLGGSVTDTGNLLPITKEPTGLGYDPDTNTYFISSDSGQKLFVDRPGNDNRLGTSDDQVTTINLTNYGVGDAEDVAFDWHNHHVYVSDGVNKAFWQIQPGADGTYANGAGSATKYDLSAFGGQDEEGLGFDQTNNTILVGDRKNRSLIRMTESGGFVETINLKGITGLLNVSDVAVAPASDGANRMDYYVTDRGVDNGPVPSENDGMVWEISLGGGSPPPDQTPPSVSMTAPPAGTVSGTVPVSADATDNAGGSGMKSVEFRVTDGSNNTTSLGVDSSGPPWSASWNTTGFANGLYTVFAVATDNQNNSTVASGVLVTVNNVTPPQDNIPPTVSITAPLANATVSGTGVTVSANATDNAGGSGMKSVEFFAGGTSLGTDNNGGDGWSVSWNTTLFSNGPITLTATATDIANNTASATGVGVTVSNGGGGGTTTLNVPISVGGNDVEEIAGTGKITTASSDLDILLDGTVQQAAAGLRFDALAIPKNATITSAYVQFSANESQSAATSFTIKIQDSDNAPAFTTTKFMLSSRTTIGGSVAWSAAAWAGKHQKLAAEQTPSLASLLQSIVNRGGWSSGNAIVLIITGSGQRTADSFEQGNPAVLHVEFS